MRDYVWAVEVTAMPEGSVTEDGEFTPGWEPPNWPEERASLKRAGLMRPEETEFFWPSMDKVWMSRSTAAKRVKLLERYGATAHVVRSPLQWEVPGSRKASTYGSGLSEHQGPGGVQAVYECLVDIRARLDVIISGPDDSQRNTVRDEHDLSIPRGIFSLNPEGIAHSVGLHKGRLERLQHAVLDVEDGGSVAGSIDELSHDSSPSVGGRRNPQPTEGEANAVRAAARELADEHWTEVGASRYYADNAAEVLNRIADRIEKGGDAA